ncbi:MAG TPA: hypothetical protein VHV83_22390 [Armatimonadota bacterium]|nr:hypothetical protein [Armatimonadota bacterium]
MEHLPCPYLCCEVEFGDERELHITERHPDLMPGERGRIADTLAAPDEVRHSTRFENALLFSRWFPALRGGKYVVVVVLIEKAACRAWIITAYIARKLAEGEVEWKRI